MTNDRTILITGVTGQQGGAVAQALQGAGFRTSAKVFKKARTCWSAVRASQRVLRRVIS